MHAALEVSDSDPAVECDECGHWFHIQCQSIDQGTYDDWVASDHSFSWICSKCDRPNFSNIAQSSFASYESQNNFSVLLDETPSPHHSRDPSPTSQAAQPRRTASTAKISKLWVMNINCQSLANKKAEFYSLLDTHKPDIVIGTESWLTPNHSDSDFFFLSHLVSLLLGKTERKIQQGEVSLY